MLSTSPTLVPLTHCDICGSEQLTPINQERIVVKKPATETLLAYDNTTFWLNRCSQCGFMQPEGLPHSSKFFDELYDQGMTPSEMEILYASPFKDFIFQSILKYLGQQLSYDRRSLLDVGTNLGRLLTIAAQAGWKAEGIELSSRFAQFAAQHTGLPVHSINASQLAQTNRRYDAILMTDVLEHIPDPVSILASLRELLHPGGWIAIKVPCGINQLLKQRVRKALGQTSHAEIAGNMVHINHFSPKSLETALARAEFDSIRIQNAEPVLPPMQWSTDVVLSRLFRASVYGAGKLLPIGVHTPLAFNLQAYARRAS